MKEFHKIKLGEKMEAFSKLPQAVQDALKTAKANHDEAAIKQILKENGIVPPAKFRMHEKLHDQDNEDVSTSSANK